MKKNHKILFQNRNNENTKIIKHWVNLQPNTKEKKKYL